LRILFICSRSPYPPIKGDRLRAYYQIRELSKIHRLTLISFSEDTEYIENQKILKEFCEKVIIVPHNKLTAEKNIMDNIATFLPAQCAYYQSRRMAEAITKELSNNTYNIVHIQLARMMPYAVLIRHLPADIPIFVDFIDSLSLNIYNRLVRENIFLKPLFFYEWYKITKYEMGLEPYFDEAIITSPVDRDILPYKEKVKVLPNGVDLERFPYSSTKQRNPFTIIFSGNMGYFPNVDAVLFFSNYIYSKIKMCIPEVKFQIVGTHPSSKIRKIESLARGIEVVGFTKNVAEYLVKATIAVAPMLSGSGIQNKVLEALATGTPVVATSIAAKALETKPDRDIIIANEPEQFAKTVINLLKNPGLRQYLSINGRKLVEEKYSWSLICHRLEDIYRETIDTFKKR